MTLEPAEHWRLVVDPETSEPVPVVESDSEDDSVPSVVDGAEGGGAATLNEATKDGVLEYPPFHCQWAVS